MRKLMYFFADWCGPCRSLSPTLDNISDEIMIEKIDVDHNKEMVMNHKVRSVPTVILIVNDIEIKRFVGNKSKQDILSFIQ